MAGPQDQLHEPRNPDQARPLERDSTTAELRERLERLPPNHPSSPYNDDGSRKPPEPGPASRELPIPGDPDYRPDSPEAPRPDLSADANDVPNVPAIEPLTDAEYAAHVGEVRNRLEQAREAGLATDEALTLDKRGEVWSKERTAHHLAIVIEIYDGAASVPNEHKAILAGGLPGAGKTTILDGFAGIDRSQFLTIDPDSIKSKMAQQGLIPRVEGLAPMEASDLVHEESSQIAKRLANLAQADGKNIIWDVTMSKLSSTQGRIDELRADGYGNIEGIFVDIPPDISKARAESRHRIGLEENRNGRGDGGRLIPEELIDQSSDATWGSINRGVFEQVKHLLDKWSVYDNSVDGRPPVRVSSSETPGRER